MPGRPPLYERPLGAVKPCALTLRRAHATALALTAAALAAATDARALEIAARTRNGYVMVDEPGAEVVYEGRAPVDSTTAILAFVSEVTRLIAERPDAPRARFVAVMQSRRGFGGALAFYMPIANTVRGIGQRQGNRETWDLNDTAGTAFPLLGYVWLNSWEMYTGAAGRFGNYQVCTQEFGHRWGPQVVIPPFPTGRGIAGQDAGDAASDGGDDASAPDGSASDGGTPPPLAVTPLELLGRDRVHWSFFFDSGGSPLEGNAWAEVSPGVFRTLPPTYRFSRLDLYMMGVLAPEEVPSSFLIAEPNTMGARDGIGNLINAASGPDPGDHGLEIRGRRVEIGIEDIVRANGPRVPAAVSVAPTRDSDGGLLPDASAALPPAPRENDIDVIWVMLTTRDRMRELDVYQFDNAVESCSFAYAYASEGRSVLYPIIPSLPDGGVDSGVAARDATVPPRDASRDAARDGGIGAEGTLGGGCACRAGRPRGRDARGPSWLWGGLAAWALARRSRRPAR